MKFSQLMVELKIPLTQTSLTRPGAVDPELKGVAAIDCATANTLSFIEGKRYRSWITTTHASALILPEDPGFLAAATARNLAWVATPQPRWQFAQALQQFYQPWCPSPGIHPTAILEPTVQLGQGVSIGAHVIIHGPTVVGDQVCIHANSVIYPGVVLGDRTLLHANCVIHERTEIGQDCVIHSGAVLGAEGFGFVRTAEGWHKMPQSGRTVLEDQVEVGCNTCIDRPAVGETRIGRGTKIDNLVQVGHGCQIHSHCALAGQVGLAGRVTLESGVILAGQVGVADQVTVGAGALATARAGITQNIGEGEVVSGFPAMPSRLWLKATAILRRLPHRHHASQNSPMNARVSSNRGISK
ncbi:UDP-3-O-(3-hydroxymyristoyl)glucosamine N-acyltransferase [Synechococcales cyanobacterium C]|uniref:UDP-3-O-acylglucosamine N-acyltransferase n=1 Tax=Petrachloros mirabilis ULC683 TaxID=2781853 RepID=A0A8K1ZXG7_9CYAN|nr:UDP-3-O-(3-hydroxymyristoyl)glucosamine N-acyltransferase [Petrachloros mirabilis]NCJ05467.1 UDP-3-O-(3-hydroxymyristoyl)glucosamine N-acyltransferase [Petrachloros mirabilis ULC683]